MRNEDWNYKKCTVSIKRTVQTLHAVWVYKKHLYKKRPVGFSKNKKRRLVEFWGTKKRQTKKAWWDLICNLKKYVSI